MPHILPVILSGGSGTRLWPLSRALYPKQLLPITCEKTLLQQTALRFADSKLFLPPMIICNEAHRFLIAEQLRQIGIENPVILLEPEGKNTAPASCIAALYAAEFIEKDVSLLILPADHLLKTENSFYETLKEAHRLAKEQHKLVTFGICPTRPETGYGYIQKGAELPEASAFTVTCFTEKPSLDRAKTYLESKEYYWNSGMFLFTAENVLESFNAHAPHIVKTCIESMKELQKDLDFIRLDKNAFSKADNISIDYAIFEKAENAAVIPLSCEWSDIGAWDAVDEFQEKDTNNNVCTGDVLTESTNACYIRAESRLVTTVGVSDLIIVETADAVLVAHKDSAQDVKKIVAQLNEKNREESQLHRRVYRPWGFYETLTENKRFKVKRIYVHPEGILSLQKHFHRAEHWVVVSGAAEIINGDETLFLTENQSTYIPINAQHRLKNIGKLPLEIIEVQTGSYLGEDDIVRIADQYGR